MRAETQFVYRRTKAVDLSRFRYEGRVFWGKARGLPGTRDLNHSRCTFRMLLWAISALSRVHAVALDAVYAKPRLPEAHSATRDPMEITAERAFWILDYYQRHESVLAFGGRILGEDAACEALISYIWPESKALGIKLLSEDRKQSWDRVVPLQRARFDLVQMGDADFKRFRNTTFHSVLIIGFPDGTTVFLAEQMPAEGVPETFPGR